MILVSACLLGNRVRYDGRALPIASERLRRWQSEGRLLAFCPEVAGGLPVPRPRSEIMGGDGNSVLSGHATVAAHDGTDNTAAFINGAKRALSDCQAHGIQIAVLSESSPSCGSSTIHDGHFLGNKISGMGVTTALLRKHGIHVFSQHETDKLAAFLNRNK